MSALQVNNSRAGSRPSSVRSFDPFKATRDVINGSLRPTLRLVALVLISHANSSGEAFPGYGTLGRETGLARRTAISAIAGLERAGLVEKQRRRTPKGDNTSNLYRLRLGLPERPSEPELEGGGDRDVSQVALVPGDVQQLAAVGVEDDDQGALERGGDRQVPTVVIAEHDPGDRVAPKQLTERSKEVRGTTPAQPGLITPARETDPWEALIRAYSAERQARYGIRGLIEPVKAEQREAVTRCLVELTTVRADGLEALVKAWFGELGRDGYLREQKHPFRALLADLDKMIARVAGARVKASRVVIEPEPEPPWPMEKRLGMFRIGASQVLEALRSRAG